MLESQLFEQDQVQYDELYTTRALDQAYTPMLSHASSDRHAKVLAHQQTTDAFLKHWGKDGWVQDELLDSYKMFGINSVRVPVGYWMFEENVGSSNRTRDGYVYGSKAKLKTLIDRVLQRNMEVIIVMSALPGGQTCCSTAAGRHTCATTNIYGPWPSEAPDFFTGYASSSVDDPLHVTTCGVEYGSSQHKLQPKMWHHTAQSRAQCGEIPPNFYTDDPTHYTSSKYSKTTSNGLSNPYYPPDDGIYPTQCPSMQVENSKVWGGYNWEDPNTKITYKDTLNPNQQGQFYKQGETSREYHLPPLSPLQRRGLDAFTGLLHFVQEFPSDIRDKITVVPYANMAKGTSTTGPLHKDLQYAITTYHFHVLHALLNTQTRDQKPVQFMLNDEGVPIFDPTKVFSEPPPPPPTGSEPPPPSPTGSPTGFERPKYQLGWPASYYHIVLNHDQSYNSYQQSYFKGYETSASFNYAQSHNMPVEAGVETSDPKKLRCLAHPTNPTCDASLWTSIVTSTLDTEDIKDIKPYTLGANVWEYIIKPLYGPLQGSPTASPIASWYTSQWQFMGHTDMFRWTSPEFRSGHASGAPDEAGSMTPMSVRVSFGTGRSSYDATSSRDSAKTQALLLTTVREFFARVQSSETEQTIHDRYKLTIVFDTARTGVGYRFHTGLPGVFSQLIPPTLTNGMDGNDPARTTPAWHYPKTSSIGWLMAHGQLYDHNNLGTFTTFQYQSVISPPPPSPPPSPPPPSPPPSPPPPSPPPSPPETVAEEILDAILG